VNDRKLEELARCTASRIDICAQRAENSTDSVLPSWFVHRRDRLDPSVRQSNTDSAELNRVKLRKLREEPTSSCADTDIRSEIRHFPTMEIPVPTIETRPRKLMEEPM
jgi:hypothetical protein